jgi:hypothetical protein
MIIILTDAAAARPLELEPAPPIQQDQIRAIPIESPQTPHAQKATFTHRSGHRQLSQGPAHQQTLAVNQEQVDFQAAFTAEERYRPDS